MFDGFQREAFRLETLDDYSGSSSAENLRAFFAGESKPADYNAGWLDQLRRNADAGRRTYRVHIVARPLSDYLRYELEWGYLTNITAGEEFFILDTTDQRNPLGGVPDFWLFDEATAVTMSYDKAGAFLGASRETDPAEWVGIRDVAMAAAEPFTTWWERHGSR